MAKLISVDDCPCDGCKAKPCGHPARCVPFTLWLNKTVEAVVVTRCKDCKRSDYSGCADGVLYCLEHGCYMDENGYCSDGKREDDHAAD